MLSAHATAPCLDKPRGPSSQISRPTSHFSALARSLRYVFLSRIQMQYLPSPRPRPRQPIASALLPPPTDRLSPLASCILRPCTLRPSPCALRPTVQGLPVTLPPRRLASSRYSVCRSSTSRRCPRLESSRHLQHEQRSEVATCVRLRVPRECSVHAIRYSTAYE